MGTTARTGLAEDPACTAAFPEERSPPCSAEFYFGPCLHLAPQPGDRLFVHEGRRWQEGAR